MFTFMHGSDLICLLKKKCDILTESSVSQDLGEGGVKQCIPTPTVSVSGDVQRHFIMSDASEV